MADQGGPRPLRTPATQTLPVQTVQCWTELGKKMLSGVMANHQELNRPQECSEHLQLILLQANLQTSRREPTLERDAHFPSAKQENEANLSFMNG